MFARRLQIQEQLTTQIADTIQITGARRGVMLEPQRFCMMTRGVQKKLVDRHLDDAQSLPRSSPNPAGVFAVDRKVELIKEGQDWTNPPIVGNQPY